jgi:hypothetical protein
MACRFAASTFLAISANANVRAWKAAVPSLAAAAIQSAATCWLLFATALSAVARIIAAVTSALATSAAASGVATEIESPVPQI